MKADNNQSKSSIRSKNVKLMFDWVEWLLSARMHSEHKEKGRFVGGGKKTLSRDNYLHSDECSQLYLEVAQIKFWEHMRPKRSQFRAQSCEFCDWYAVINIKREILHWYAFPAQAEVETEDCQSRMAGHSLSRGDSTFGWHFLLLRSLCAPALLFNTCPSLLRPVFGF